MPASIPNPSAPGPTRPSRPGGAILAVVGTRPEAIKLARVVHSLAGRQADIRVCLTGQHRELLEQGLDCFGLRIDHDLAVMTQDQTLPDLTARIVGGLADVIRKVEPAWIVVQGDTNSALAAGLAAFQSGVRVAHVEAGLRSFDTAHPWPEEMNRRLLGQLASLHFAPDEEARGNLLREGVAADTVHVTGNTVVDALRWGMERLAQDPAVAGAAASIPAAFGEGAAPLLLATVHRRENLPHLPAIEAALLQLASRGDCRIIFLAHANPHVRAMAERLAAVRKPNLLIAPPLPYLPFLALLQKTSLVLTDSGGLQEEAVTLGKPVLVLRQATERPGLQRERHGLLVGIESDAIVQAAATLLTDEAARLALAHPSELFGDGRAAERIADLLLAS